MGRPAQCPRKQHTAGCGFHIRHVWVNIHSSHDTLRITRKDGTADPVTLNACMAATNLRNTPCPVSIHHTLSEPGWMSGRPSLHLTGDRVDAARLPDGSKFRLRQSGGDPVHQLLA